MEIEPRSSKETSNSIQKSELFIYPNPVQDTWNVQTTLTLPVRYEILDVQGVVVHSGHQGISPFTITADLPSGVYIVRLIDDQGKTAVKGVSVIK